MRRTAGWSTWRLATILHFSQYCQQSAGQLQQKSGTVQLQQSDQEDKSSEHKRFNVRDGRLED